MPPALLEGKLSYKPIQATIYAVDETLAALLKAELKRSGVLPLARKASISFDAPFKVLNNAENAGDVPEEEKGQSDR